jgi:transcriptional regulator with PAS, ATPase and Fis domain
VGRNREVLDTLALIPRVAGTAVPVLIRGESGTGKELIARALHESGPRAEKPFVTVNCAAVPENLLEAEFFGVVKGAATGVEARPGKFELANGGTVFLDEIGDMSSGLQAKLLRVIEDKAVTRVGGTKATLVDVRVVAATNMDLDLRERQGLFRRDLMYRLNNRTVRRANDEVLALFAEYPWPGNIRQLQHVVERAVILAAGDTLEVTDLPLELRQTGTLSTARPVAVTRVERSNAVAEAERTMLFESLNRANGNATEAAKLTGYSRAQFYRLLRKHHITDPD